MFPPRDTFTRTMRPLCTAGDLSVPAGGLPFITIVMVIATASSAKGLEAYLHSEPGPPRWWLNLPRAWAGPEHPAACRSFRLSRLAGQRGPASCPVLILPAVGGKGSSSWDGASMGQGQNGARGSSGGKVLRQRSRWELSAFLLSVCVSPGRRRVFHSSLSPGSQHKPPSVLVNGRGVLGGGRSLVSGGIRPRGDGDGLFFRPQLFDTSWKFQGS